MSLRQSQYYWADWEMVHVKCIMLPTAKNKAALHRLDCWSARLAAAKIPLQDNNKTTFAATAQHRFCPINPVLDECKCQFNHVT